MFKNISVILKNMFEISDSPVSVITDNVDVSEDEKEKTWLQNPSCSLKQLQKS